MRRKGFYDVKKCCKITNIDVCVNNHTILGVHHDAHTVVLPMWPRILLSQGNRLKLLYIIVEAPVSPAGDIVGYGRNRGGYSASCALAGRPRTELCNVNVQGDAGGVEPR